MSIAWAQRLVDCQSIAAKVDRLAVTSVDVGTTTRVRLVVDHDGPDSLPGQWFVKLPSLNWRARVITSLPQLLAREVRFYNTIASELPVSLPSVLMAQNRRYRGSTLVLADLHETAAVPGNSCDTLTVAQAQKVLGQLAAIHAQYWGKMQSDPRYLWLGDSVRRVENTLATVLAVPLMRQGLSRIGHGIPPELRRSALLYARHRGEIARMLADGPQTLVHYDCHPGNLFWRENEPGLLDWQLVRSGEGIGDVAYFLATALAPETRRAHELDLLRAYWLALQEKGVAGLDFERLLLRYRLHLAYPFEAMVVTLAIGGMMNEQCNLKLIERASAAIQDWDSFGAIAESFPVGKGKPSAGKRIAVNI